MLLCSQLANYMEAHSSSGRVPWEDLRYLFGDILYGGHITDDYDRLVATTYLDWVMKVGEGRDWAG